MYKIFTILTFLLITSATLAKSPYKIKGDPIKFMEDGGWCWYEDPRAIIHDAN